MKKSITLRHFFIFICVCEENNMTRAAKRLHMTQPSVSQAIQEIETRYDTKLFERLNKHLYITSAGKCLLQYAYQIFSLTKQIDTSMTSFQKTNPLRIGASVTIGELCLIEYIHYLKQTHHIKIVSEIHNTTELEAMLLSDKLDFALVEGNIHSEYLLAQPFMSDELVVALPLTHPLLTKQHIDLIDLQDISLFLREEGSGTRDMFIHLMKEQHVAFSIDGSYNNTESLKKAVIAGLGGTILSYHLVEKEVRAGLLGICYVKNNIFKRNFKITYHKNKFLFPELKKAFALCYDYTKWFPSPHINSLP
ncbi:LysR family transcriptional regulator [uncultured Megasphaera sp.]|uniref:LysR family transcriptional regulator n=1 Tax=uncultured Megasphaera sp. TaxID=165188 RepID=UPI00259B8F53|nr:LysR family transcriptional regulator [uncultured Megasphaera sp.]